MSGGENDGAVTEHRLLFERAADGVFVADPGGRFLDANERGLSMLGYSLAELRELSLTDVVSESDPNPTPRIAELQQGKLLTSERVLQRKDGTDFTVEISAASLPDGRLLGLVRDVTERKRMETELRDSEERYRVLVENSNLGLLLFQDGRIVFANSVYAELSGYSREELLAKSPEETLALVHPEDRAVVSERIQARLEGQYVPARYQFRVLSPSGQVRWVDVSSTLVQFRGRPALQTTVIDITERRAAEEALIARERYFRQLIEASSDAIAVFSVDRTLQYVSPAIERISGYPPEVLLETGPWPMVPPEEHAQIENSFRALEADPDRPVELRGRLKHREGGWRRVESTSTAVVEDGAISYFIITLRDVTDRVLAEERLARTQKLDAVGRLAGGVAHDFNNLLSVVMAESGMAASRVDPESRLAGHLQSIQDASRRAAELTRQLLSFSRHQLIEPTVFPLAEVVRDTSRMLRRLIGEDIELATDLDPDTGAVLADRGQIEQLVVNLAVNARDAMPRGGRLEITTRPRELDAGERDVPPGPYAELVVADTGTGMSDEVKKRLFEPFFSTKEAGRGTGLGLATCYGIIKRFGGDVRVETELGRGSSFEVVFPRSMLAATRPVEARAAGEGPGGDETILLVEDEAPLRRALAQILEGLGYDVAAAAGAEEALKLFEERGRKVQLLLTDMVLPDTSGAALAERIRESGHDVRVLLMSGYSEEKLREEIPGERRLATLHKPFTPEALARRVRESLD